MKISVKNSKKEFEIEGYFIDLDGTSLDKKRHSISEKNINKIKEINKITPVIISTGRSFSDTVKKLMILLEIKYAICQNGAIIANNKNEILRDVTIEKSMVQAIKEVTIKNKLTIIPNSEYLVYDSRWFMKPLIFFSPKHYFNLEEFNEFKKYNKLILSGCTKRKLFKIYDELKSKFPMLSIKTSANDRIIEITDIKATKGLASVFVANLLKIKPEKSVHIGDSMNDTTTINYLGALIAMENSSKHLLNVATHIGPNYKKGGLAKVLDGEFLENNLKK